MLRRLISSLFRPAPPATPAPAAVDPYAVVESHLARRRIDEARDALDAARAARPDEARVAYFEAEIRRRRGDWGQAMPRFRRALVLAPRNADAWAGLGDCCARTDDGLQALNCYRAALSIDPSRADILNEAGLVRLSLGNRSAAAEAFERAVDLDPRHAEAWNNFGLVAAQSGRLEQARRHFHRATHLRPDFYTALCNLGLACRDLGREVEAREALERATRADPSKPAAWINLGMLRQDAGELGAAREAFERACACDPVDRGARTARGVLLGRMGDHDGAERELAAVLAAAPADPEAALAQAHLDLLRGRYAQGWDRYEARLRAAQSPRRRYLAPDWDGEPVEGRELLVYAEQGLGDTVLFASCLPDLLARAASCAVDCEDRLWPVLQRSFPGLRRHDPASAARYDAAIAIGSLPRLYRRSHEAFPHHAGYLEPDASRVQAMRAALDAAGSGFRIGLAWRGGLRGTGETVRSIAHADLAPLLTLPGTRWFSLQHGVDDAERARVEAAAGARLHALPGVPSDLEALLAAIDALDLVVTVCCSVVHLAGALGRDVRVLVPKGPSWRYGHEGDAMPWYPSARLYRQKDAADWRDPVARLRADLDAMARA